MNNLPDTHFLPIDRSIHHVAHEPEVRTVRPFCMGAKRHQQAMATLKLGLQRILQKWDLFLNKKLMSTQTTKGLPPSGTMTMRWELHALMYMQG